MVCQERGRYGVHEPETLYARFGHWLAENDDDDTLINTYAVGGAAGNDPTNTMDLVSDRD